MDSLPDEVLGHIFSYLSLASRSKCSQACRDWRRLLSHSSYSMRDVVVMNLFERQVWVNNVNESAGTRIRCIPLKQVDSLPHVLLHFNSINSIKLWFRETRFVERILSYLHQRKLKLRCLDVYPYGDQLPLHLVLRFFPALTAMTLRPHGNDYFWDGLTVPDLPAFERLETLVLDSVNLGPDAQLPPSLTQLEWTNRREPRFREFLPKLAPLHRLEYILLGHVNFTETNLLTDFFRLVKTSLRSLQFFVFRFVKFPTNPWAWAVQDPDPTSTPCLAAAKVIKLDLCYGDLAISVQQILDATTPSVLKILSLNYIYEDLQLAKFYSILPLLEKRQISLHFGLLQKGTPPSREFPRRRLPLLERNLEDVINPPEAAPNDDEAEEGKVTLTPPLVLRDVLWKIDVSFLDDSVLLRTLLSCGTYYQLSEMKFVQCSAVSDEFLGVVARSCPRIRKLSLAACENITGKGINHFFQEWPVRKSKHLHIFWKYKDHPASFYLDLLKDRTGLLDGLRSRFVTKKLPGDMDGERILIWDKDYSTSAAGKSMVIQDYSDSEGHWILGFAIPTPDAPDDEDAETLASDTDVEDTV